ncbi:helix-turn-helix domain-containing protein [uncultured Shewanella sp.]|uniref:TetR/AcrR family transcriptional regulator n=1 Tax=uncultured Shewanella sp. TaxID=173975 RepID=UPI0026193F86|nr:helix-turn-helix domain-containing protein [uncultured Shewanella sp.]
MKLAKTDKKQAILDAALILFVEQGFHGTSTASIARKSGVATGTLFHHFPTKEALLNHLFVAVKQEFADSITSSMAKLSADEVAIQLNDDTITGSTELNPSQSLSADVNNAATLKNSANSLWQHAIDWALLYPIKQRFFLQFSLSSEIDAEIRSQAMSSILHFIIELIAKGQQLNIIANFPLALMLENCHGQYLAAIRYFTDNPQWGHDKTHRDASFEMFWRSMKI